MSPVMFIVIATAFSLASLAFWAVALRRCLHGLPLRPFEPRRRVPWGLLDLAMIGVATLLVQLSLAALADRVLGIAPGVNIKGLPVDQLVSMLLAGSVLSALTTAFALVLVAFRAGATIRDLGLNQSKLAGDLVLGLRAFVMLALPVYAVQWLAQWVWLHWNQQRADHTLIKLLQERPVPSSWLLACFAAVLVAPLIEEYLFRVLLQGWLENVATVLRRRRLGLAVTEQSISQLLLGDVDAARSIQPAGEGETDRSPIADTQSTEDEDAAIDTLEDANPYRPPPAATISDTATEPIADVGRRQDEPRPSAWPILVSSAIFALMHWGNGPDPIPLFLLALGLGYLYQRTHRAMPCVVVHMLLNACSLAMLWLELAAD